MLCSATALLITLGLIFFRHAAGFSVLFVDQTSGRILQVDLYIAIHKLEQQRLQTWDVKSMSYSARVTDIKLVIRSGTHCQYVDGQNPALPTRRNIP